MREEFLESYEQFQAWRSENEQIGLCNWEIEEEDFILSCWTHKSLGAIIFQIWPDGYGFRQFSEIHINKL